MTFCHKPINKKANLFKHCKRDSAGTNIAKIQISIESTNFGQQTLRKYFYSEKFIATISMRA